MTNTIKYLLKICAILPLVTGPVAAVPTLQLDIDSPSTFYLTGTETIVTVDQGFTLRALGKVLDIDGFSDPTFYLSIALTPLQAEQPAPNLGSFMIGGTTISQANMIFGVPPMDDALLGLGADPDGGDLPAHGIFET